MIVSVAVANSQNSDSVRVNNANSARGRSRCYCVRLGGPSKRRWPEGRKWRQNAASQRGDGGCKQRASRGAVRTLARRRPASRSIRPGETQGTVDAPPEVAVANRDQFTESFPLPVVFAPLAELAADAAADVAAAGEQRDAGRAIDRFEAADDGEQLQAAGTRLEFRVGGRELLSPPTDCSTNFQCGAGRPSGSLRRRAGSDRWLQLCIGDEAIVNGWAHVRSGEQFWPTSMQAGRKQWSPTSLCYRQITPSA